MLDQTLLNPTGFISHNRLVKCRWKTFGNGRQIKHSWRVIRRTDHIQNGPIRLFFTANYLQPQRGSQSLPLLLHLLWIKGQFTAAAFSFCPNLGL